MKLFDELELTAHGWPVIAVLFLASVGCGYTLVKIWEVVR